MSGTRSLRQLLFAKETTAGTEVHIATVAWRGETDGIEDKRGLAKVPEDIGRIMGANRTHVPFLLGGVPILSTPATFEQLPYILAMAIKNLTAGVADGGGSGYVYTYPLPNTSWNTPQSYSVQAGDDQEVEFGTYAFCESFSLSGKPKEPVMMSAELTCRDVDRKQLTGTGIAFDTSTDSITDTGNTIGTIFAVGDKIVVSGSTDGTNDGTYTVATVVGVGEITVSENLTTQIAGPSVTIRRTFSVVAAPTIEEINFGKGKLYIDAVGGTLGTTQKSNTFIGMTLNVAKAGWAPRFSGDGNLYYSGLRHTVPDISLELTFEFDGSAVAERANYRAQTPRQLRLLFQGAALATAATYTYKSLVIDLAGKWTSFTKLAEDDGNDIITGTFVPGYDSTAALLGNIVVVNELSSLT